MPDLERLVRLAKTLLEANKDRRRITTGGPAGRNASPYWVYGRACKPCLRCRTPIVYTKLGENVLTERDLYFCPHCQPETI